MTARRAARGDAGESLLEIVVAIAITGIAFAALLGGVLMSSQTSGLHRLQADASTYLVSAIEQIKNAAYVNCATSTSYPVSVPWTSTSQAVQYWNGTGFGATCFDTEPMLKYSTQKIVVTVTSPDGRVTRTQTILKRG